MNFAQTLQRIKQTDYASSFALPGAFYTDPAILQAELSQLFAQQWVCVGRIEEIPNSGDYFTYTLGAEPLLIVRTEDNAIRALSNVCRHRATVLAEGSGNTKRFVCPYHHWSYDITGQLLNAPRVDERADFTIKNCRLPEFNCEVWQGFIFVSLSKDNCDLKQQLGTLNDMIANYHLEDMKLRYLAHETWEVNWKHLLENFMEGYHLSPLHRNTLHKVNPSRLCQHILPGEHWFGYQVGFTERVPDDQIGHPDLSTEQLNNCIMFAVPPGFAVGIGSDYSSFLCMQPLTVDSVKVKMGLIFYGDSWTEQELDNAVTLFKETMREDKEVLLRVQKGVRSAHYFSGPLAQPHLEGTIWDFYQYLARHLTL